MKKLLLVTALMAFTLVLNAQSSTKLTEAEARMEKYSANDIKAKNLLKEVLKEEPENERANYLQAKAYLERNAHRYAKKHINKAIEANPTNADYRWIRIKSNMTSRSDAEDYKAALEDIKYLQSQGEDAKLYAYEAIAERELAGTYLEFGKDDEALQHFKNAHTAGKKALDLDDSYNGDIRLSSIENNVKELTK